MDATIKVPRAIGIDVRLPAVAELSLDFGWYGGEPFKLFDLTLFEAWDNSLGDWGLTIFSLQVTMIHFSISINGVE